MTSQGTIRIAAAVIFDEHGKFLVVRKRGSLAYMQAGGKIEGDETARVALARELLEELGATASPDAFEHIGDFTDDAVNERGWRVSAAVYRATLEAEPQPHAEIEELAWIDPRGPFDALPHPLAPLTRQIITAVTAA